MPLAPTRSLSFFFFFNDTATTEIYTLSLHDALPILVVGLPTGRMRHFSISTPLGSALGKLKMTCGWKSRPANAVAGGDRKSTRLNSSHSQISYAVFCLKKKKKMSDEVRSDSTMPH